MYKNILDKIVTFKRTEVANCKNSISLNEIEKTLDDAPPIRDFTAAIRSAENVALIAEVKKASPSQGVIRDDFDPVQIAGHYQSSGASCISVLTDREFFQGDLNYLREIRGVSNLPLLRKDFVIDRYQVFEARNAGADAVLLIAECLDDQDLRDLRICIEDLGMVALVEFYEPGNLQRVVDSGARLIGINNRNLKTFEVSIQHAIELRQQIDAEIPVVAESGIFTHEHVRQLQTANIQAMLVGQSLMEQTDIELAVRQLLGN